MLKNHIESISAYAPASTSNLTVGFDLLGLSLSFLRDEVTLMRRTDKDIVIQSIDSPYDIPKDPKKNTATIALHAMSKALDLKTGFDVFIKKGIPISGGLGGSAASAVASVVALNGFLERPVNKKTLAQFASQGEGAISGAKHLDNIVPALWGGLTFIRDNETCDVVSLPCPNLYILIVHPDFQIQTKKAREALASKIELVKHVRQSGNLGAFIAACYTKDNALLSRAMQDEVIEPQRAHLLPGFETLIKVAKSNGAISCSFSGAGPSLYALAKGRESAKVIGEALVDTFKSLDLKSEYWFEKIGHIQADVLETV